METLPQIDLELIKNQKCLLCGAGTLGTYISRVLLAWGCANITFIDNGKYHIVILSDNVYLIY